jgi:5,10-methylenetetrahydromethanopterin reductase
LKIALAHVPRFDFRDSVRLICDAETWGYDTAWLADQPLYRDPYTILAASAGATSRIRLGVGVTNPLTTHPVITARLAATLAEAADGRFVLGIGTGNKREFLTPLGYPTTALPERCRDAIQVMRQLWAGETTHYRNYFVADGSRLSFPALPGIPIYVAGIAPRILEVAGACADGVIVNLASPSIIAYALEHVQRGRRQPGAFAGSLDIVAWVYTLISADRAKAYDSVRPMVAHTIAPTARATLAAAGMSDETITAVRQAYRTYGAERAASFVDNGVVDHWAWCGSPEEVVERCVDLEAVGVTQTCIIPWTQNLDEMRHIARTFAERVRSRL